jgi:hypothetical protein
MSLTDSRWTLFQIEAEEEHFGLSRIVEAHNEIYGKMVYAQKMSVQLQTEIDKLKNIIREEGKKWAEHHDRPEKKKYWEDFSKKAERQEGDG